MLGGAACPLWTRVTARIRQLLQTAKAVVDRGLRKLHPPRQLAQVQLRMLAPPAGHLAQRRRKPLQTTAALEPFDRGRLAETGSRSEEHTSELQSHLNLVFRLLLQKKNPTSRHQPPPP